MMAERTDDEARDLESQPAKKAREPARDDHPVPSPTHVDGMIAGPNDDEKKRYSNELSRDELDDRSDDDKNVVDVIVASLRAAQNACDAGRDSANRVVLPGMDGLHATSHASRSYFHLEHAAHAAKIYDRRGPASVWSAADAFAISLADFVVLNAVDESIREDLEATNRLLRRALRLPEIAAKPKGYKKELKTEDSYIRRAIPPTFGTIVDQASLALELLENSPVLEPAAAERDARRRAKVDTDGMDDEPRSPDDGAYALDSAPDRPTHYRSWVTTNVAGRIAGHVEYATWLLDQIERFDERVAFAGHAERAAASIQHLDVWIRSRTGNAAMIHSLRPIIAELNRSLVLVGAKSFDQQQVPALKRGEAVEATRETDDLDDVADRLIASMGTLASHRILGIDRFEKLAAMKENQPPGFLHRLIEGILIASLGHLGGGLFATLGRVLNSPRNVMGSIANVTTDAIQGIVGGATSEALRDAANTNDEIRARTYFVEGHKKGIAAITAWAQGLVSAAKKARGATSETLTPLLVLIASRLDSATDDTFRAVSTAWASYVAQANLGKTTSGQHVVSNLDHYFGRDHSKDHFGGKPYRGSAGVLDVGFRILDDPFTDREPEIELRSFSIRGINTDIQNAILEEAGWDLARVPLPKEVTVDLVGVGSSARLAIDELGVVRDEHRWDSRIAIHGGKPRFYRDPQTFWSRVSSTRLHSKRGR